MRALTSRRMAVGVSALAFLLRVSRLSYQSLWRDEVDAVRFAARPLPELLAGFQAPGQNGPLYYFLLHPWLLAAGHSEFALRFFSLAMGMLSVPLIYQVTRRLFPRQRSMALIAALLAATSPYLVWYSQEGKMYAMVVALTLLSMERYLTALRDGGLLRWVIYVGITGAAFYVHLVTVLLVPAQLLVFLLWDGYGRKARWRPWIAASAALVVLYLPLFAWQLPFLGQTAYSGYAFVPLAEMVRSLLLTHSLGVVQVSAWWSIAPFLAVPLLAGMSWRGLDWPLAPVIILLCWLVVPTAGFYLVTLVRPLYTARYLIFVLPAYLVLLAAGIAVIYFRSVWVATLVLCTILASHGWGLWLQASTPIKTDFRAATRYVSSQLEGQDLVLFQIPYARYSFDYYFTRQSIVSKPSEAGDYLAFVPCLIVRGGALYRWADGLYTNAGMDLQEVDLRMAEIVTGSPVVWLMTTEVPMWDQRGLVQAWLDENYERVVDAQFVRVAVYRYELP